MGRGRYTEYRLLNKHSFKLKETYLTELITI